MEAGLIAARFLHFAMVMTLFGLALFPVYGYPNRAADAAHLNHPSSGLGLNTGLGDAVDLGWKLAATLAGWGGPQLLGNAAG